jgi:hypothetical protein
MPISLHSQGLLFSLGIGDVFWGGVAALDQRGK